MLSRLRPQRLPFRLRLGPRIRGYASESEAKEAAYFALSNGKSPWTKILPYIEEHGAKIGFMTMGPDLNHTAGSPREPDQETGLQRKLQRVPQFWLRDNCHCSQCINQDTLQKNYDTFKIPSNVKAKNIETASDGIRIEWSDGHKSFHPLRWVARALQSRKDAIDHEWEVQPPMSFKTPKDSSEEKPFANIDYHELMSPGQPRALKLMTKRLRRHGWVMVDNTPVTPEATQQVLEKLGPIRTTHYGGFYDFKPDLASADTAYTNLALAAHTDTTYFTEPAGYQAFHMLSHEPPPGHSDADGDLGGQTLLVDGLGAAFELRQHHREDFNVLAKIGIPWHASGNEDVSITPDNLYPAIELTQTHKIARIRWNNDDRGVVPMRDAERWYEAARKFDAFLKKPSAQNWFQLKPGSVLIFDNWRILHGRSAFKGVRRMCGGYINRDDFNSRWKLANFPRDAVLTHDLFQRAIKPYPQWRRPDRRSIPNARSHHESLEEQAAAGIGKDE